jgi:hypothetical protein
MFNFIDKNKGVLFSSSDLQSSLDFMVKRLQEEINKLNVGELERLEVVISEKVKKYQVEPLRLDKDKWFITEVDAKVDVRFDSSRLIMDTSKPVYIPGQTIKVHIPYSGDKELFYARSNTFSMNPPRAKVEKNELVLRFDVPSDVSKDLRPEIDSIVNNIEQHIEWQLSLINNHNTKLLDIANEAASQRTKQLIINQENITKLGIPVKKT